MATIEWASGAGGPWFRSWPHVAIPVTGEVMSASVAVFYRVVVGTPETMALVPGGSFQMGDNLGDSGGDETPVHSVYVSSFYVDVHEVSNEKMIEVLQWAYANGKVEVDGDTSVRNTEGDQQELIDLDGTLCQIVFVRPANQFTVKSGKGDYPCVEVTWYGAQAYCNYVGDMNGKERCIDFLNWSCDFSKHGYRLPTEAEWEKAARGGLVGKRFSWGDTISHSQANYYSYSNIWYDVSSTREYHPGYDWGTQPWTSPVGSFDTNNYGLCDMMGNVFEWCWDWYRSDWYEQAGAIQDDTTGPGSGGSERVRRGGSWSSGADYARCSDRGQYLPAVSSPALGFRVVLPSSQ